MRIIQTYRQGARVRHRHVASLGRYDEDTLKRCRAIVSEWKPLAQADLVLTALEAGSGRLQGRGYFRKFRRW
jgi:hypothetical protein